MAKHKKALYGLIGFPVKHSLSRAMHNAAFAAYSVPAEYKLFEVTPQELKNFLFERKDVSGFNITVPHKVTSFLLIKETSTTTFDTNVLLIGAINTVKRQDGKLFCYNTDWQGFRESLQADLNFSPENKNVLLIGCGGAGRAVLAGLNSMPAPANVYIYEKNNDTAETARKHFGTFQKKGVLNFNFKFISPEELPQKLAQCQLLVNATPLGMKEGDPSPIDKNLLHKGLFVYDLVYNRDTELLKDARSVCGENKVSGGLGMLLYQGAAAWELWMCEKPKGLVEIMRKALNQEIKKKC